MPLLKSAALAAAGGAEMLVMSTGPDVASLFGFLGVRRRSGAGGTGLPVGSAAVFLFFAITYLRAPIVASPTTCLTTNVETRGSNPIAATMSAPLLRP